ncbi:MAG TPA: PHP-associated domain-containing protein [Candidatus Dormibacteraeota bacterium]|nr:PHP-associated domain-containing protein [Candidatus Dormibacteraeota bacterium]
MDAAGGRGRAFVDLHSHTSASFDSLASPRAVVRAAASRGLTYLAITDHDRIDGALEAREMAIREALPLTILVGQEIRTRQGDLIGVFLERPIRSGLDAFEAIEDVRAQGGLVGIPHPFDRFRSSLLGTAEVDELAPLVDWVETHNARIMVGNGNQRAAEWAVEHELPGVAVSDAHSVLEIGVAYVALDGDPSTADGLRATLATAELVTGRATVFVRAVTPIAKLVQRARGNGRTASSIP